MLLYIIGSSHVGMAQRTNIEPQDVKISEYQDTIKALAFTVINDPDEAERYNANFKMVRTIVKALKIPNSFQFDFDSLKSITIQRSPDNNFRLFTWHVLNNNGTYRYYGAIQINTTNSLKLLPLLDFTSGIKSPQDTVLNNEKWFGAQYYKIIPVIKDGKTPYYILLGWKGNTAKSTQKVIEVLYFRDGKAFFGMPLFDGNKTYQDKNRIIFEYNRSASMLLNYELKENRIVFDHLAPPDIEMKGDFALYGPDLSYDGFKLIKGRLSFLNDIRLTNPDSEIDKLYIDPKNPQKEIINKVR
ncbi:hypothetical protein ADIARSV_0135 [Arcticibacter svalbardensis MN12-7]|uniref:Uncharacterized protein n=1 Tax=Arcticibacter svalbardensis MN12-7 TaxID=1150600 RepID=R9GY39_9SPHI|nr:hypothetical protein [Arcticibacter svalbardensis]EOR96712.1 hypothetical protein ADIARSV_0135 [Arcticibacter svalbardensis MN12-7]